MFLEQFEKRKERVKKPALLAGIAGFEPTIQESKSWVLPLHYIPIFLQQNDYIISNRISQEFSPVKLSFRSKRESGAY